MATIRPCFAVSGSISPICASISITRRSYIDWNVTARSPDALREGLQRRPGSDGLVPTRPETVRGFGVRVKKRFGLDGIRHRADAAPDSSRQSRRRALLRRQCDTVIPARSGRRHALHILHKILSRPETPPSAATNLGDFLQTALRVMKRRSLVFIVSDFISTPGWAKSLANLTQRHEVIAVRLYDPLEMEMPDLGLLVIEDAETGEQLFVDTHDKGFRKRFASVAERRERELRSAFTGGVDVLSTDHRRWANAISGSPICAIGAAIGHRWSAAH